MAEEGERRKSLITFSPVARTQLGYDRSLVPVPPQAEKGFKLGFVTFQGSALTAGLWDILMGDSLTLNLFHCGQIMKESLARQREQA